jgi:hypothetical protein
MIKRLIKCFLLAVVIFYPCLAVAVWINPKEIFHLDLTKYDLVSETKKESAHIIGYGVDINKAERVYQFLRNRFGAQYVNDKVIIYQAKPMDGPFDTAIGQIGGYYFNGTYREKFLFGYDIIVYNGKDSTLIHELTHFFFHHMKLRQSDELFAQINVDLLELQQEHMSLARMCQAVAQAFSEHLKENDTKIQNTSSNTKSTRTV